MRCSMISTPALDRIAVSDLRGSSCVEVFAPRNIEKHREYVKRNEAVGSLLRLSTLKVRLNACGSATFVYLSGYALISGICCLEYGAET
jgi:hypothetical protein